MTLLQTKMLLIISIILYIKTIFYLSSYLPYSEDTNLKWGVRRWQNIIITLLAVGTGHAALSAAIRANEERLKVLMDEKGTKYKRAGNSFFNDGANQTGISW